MIVYRLALIKFLKDLSGEGAKIYGGRWNSPGTPMIYTSSSISLASLEFICNSFQWVAPSEIGLLEIQLPSMAKLKQLDEHSLPSHWNIYPAPDSLKKIGDHWVRDNMELAIKVPSAVVPLEYNYLLNPLHPHFSKIKMKVINEYSIDSRLLSKKK